MRSFINRLKLFSVATFFMGGLILPGIALAVNFTPTAYLQISDSPFLDGNGGPFMVGDSNFFLEDFEDGSLNSTGVTGTLGSVLISTLFTDSVDAGSNGASFISGDTVLDPAFSFSFNPAAFGGLFPTHAGLVVTGLNDNETNTLELRAFDASDSLISRFQFDLLFEPNGGTSKDRFVGISDLTGISRIELAHISFPGDQIEIDHLQYGVSAVPLPSAILLLGSGMGLLVAFGKRKGLEKEG